MAFADRYLQKHAAGKPLIGIEPGADLRHIVAIPATRESGLTKCLDSLFLCDPPGAPTEVIVLINTAENSDPDTLQLNRKVHQEATAWAKEHRREDLVFHILLAEDLPARHYGAGLARKMVMDEAVHRFDALDRSDGVIVSLDADCTVERNYLSAVVQHFKSQPATHGCSIAFEHPKSGSEFPPEVYEAIKNYELHQRYYLAAVRYTGYPYAYHTVGSCFAVRAGVYCSQGGMSRRQAGEDFYFIQKVAMQGRWSECNNTTVYPSPRPSDRVPFGTGPAVKRQLEAQSTQHSGGTPHSTDIPWFPTHHPELFEMVKALYDLIPGYYAANDPASLNNALHPLLQQYMTECGFDELVAEIRANVASQAAFRERFFRKFNMLWLLQWLHFGRERGFGDVKLTEVLYNSFYNEK